MENEKKNIITRLQDFLETKKGQTLLNYLYSWGAAVVILGALFKLTHIKGADLMLFLGMGTEVLVFIISGFDRQASTLGGSEGSSAASAAGPVVIGGGAPVVIGGAPAAGEMPAVAAVGAPVAAGSPAVAGGAGVDAATIAALASAANAASAAAAAAAGSHPAGAPVVAEGAEQQLAAFEGQPVVVGQPIVAGAPTITGNGSIHIEGEGGTVNIPEVEKVTNEYIDRLRELSDTFAHLTESSEKLQVSAEEMDRLSRNLTSINTIYELHLKSLGGQIGNIDHVNDETQRMAEQIEELNRVYQRMLESMTVNMNTTPKA